MFRNFLGRCGLAEGVIERMNHDRRSDDAFPPDPFPRGDAIWRVLEMNRLSEAEQVSVERTNLLTNRVLETICSEDGVVVRVSFRREAVRGAYFGIAAACAVFGLVSWFGGDGDGGVSAEVNALAGLAEVHGVDLSGGDQFLIAHLDELLDTDVNALWLEDSVH